MSVILKTGEWEIDHFDDDELVLYHQIEDCKEWRLAYIFNSGDIENSLENIPPYCTHKVPEDILKFFKLYALTRRVKL